MESFPNILYITDVHFEKGPPHFKRSAQNLPKFFQWLEREAHRFSLLIAGGDCVSHGPARKEELIAFREKLVAMNLPFQVVAGNHDIGPSIEFAQIYPGMEDWEGDDLGRTNFGTVFPEGIRNTRTVGNVKLIFFSIRENDPDGQIPWLTEQLQDRRTALLFCHYPLVQSRSGGFCKTWGYKRIRSIREQLARLIEKQGDHIAGYFCGHQHINSRRPLGATQQIGTGALGVGTCCYRELQIRPTEIRVSTHRVPGITNWLEDAMNPDLSGDAEHPTLESYHWGNPEERDFTIPLL